MLAAFIFILILSLLIFVHELGHLLAARMVGMRVEEFAFGLPFTKPILSKKLKKIKISIYPILFGGFVKILGEDEKDLKGNVPKNAFCAKSPLQRAFVVISGVLMNFLLAVVVIGFILSQGIPMQADRVHLEDVIAGTPAAKVNLTKGDIIKKIDDKEIKSLNDLTSYTQKKLGKTITLLIQRKDKTFKVILVPRSKYPSNQGPMGVVVSNIELKEYPLHKIPYYAFVETIKFTWLILQAIYLMLKSLVTTGTLPKDIAGPVGVAQLTGQAVKFGYMAVFQLLALLSVNLAVFNILPFPALDGGRLSFIIMEIITGKKISAKVEGIVNSLGMALLFGLIIIITINDFDRIFNFTKLIAPFIPKF